MDSLEAPEGGGGGGGGEGGGERGERKGFRILFRFCFSALFFLATYFFFSLLVGLVAIAIEGFSASSPVSVPTLCRVISSNVDIKSSKVCELGHLNYKAKHVFYPLGKSRFRCRDDYYWASVFEVEYKEYFSGQLLHAVAEAPKEALPQDCRPSFGVAWLTKTKFKVNETYNCRYTLGSYKADIYDDNLFDCQAEHPSTVEMIRRFFILSTRFSSDKGGFGLKVAYTAAGVVSGMLIALCCIILIKSLQVAVLAIARRWDARKHRLRIFATRFRGACLLVAYFSAVGWLMLQYGKIIGFRHLSLGSILGERTI